VDQDHDILIVGATPGGRPRESAYAGVVLVQHSGATLEKRLLIKKFSKLIHQAIIKIEELILSVFWF
jgi:hypothetical protein